MPHYEIKHLLPVFSRMRRAVAVAVLVGVAVAPAWRRNVLTTFPFVKTANAEAPRIETSRRQKSPLTDGGAMPELEAIGWLNSAPLQRKSLRGKIVLVDFWTYTCINSLRPLPYLKSWEAKYKDAGLVVIGVHTPEFSFEKNRKNVEDAVRNLNVRYPVAIDSKPVRFKVTLDGKAPADNCGSDSAPDGTGQVQQPRLYQLIRQKGQIQDRSFEIEFLDPGVQAFVFTFG